jgi:hypothetical protein
MDYSRIVLDNHELLEEESYTPSNIEKLIKDWKCQNIRTSAESVENQNKNMHLSLVE